DQPGEQKVGEAGGGVGVKGGEKHRFKRTQGPADLIEPDGGSATDVEQQPLFSRLHQRRSAEPVGNGEWRAGPEQRHLEVLRPCREVLRPCRRRQGETSGHYHQTPNDAHSSPPRMCRSASLSGNGLDRKAARRYSV